MDYILSDFLPGEVTPLQTVGCLEDPLGDTLCTLPLVPAMGSVQYTIDVQVAEEVNYPITNLVCALPSDTIGEKQAIKPACRYSIIAAETGATATH